MRHLYAFTTGPAVLCCEECFDFLQLDLHVRRLNPNEKCYADSDGDCRIHEIGDPECERTRAAEKHVQLRAADFVLSMAPRKR